MKIIYFPGFGGDKNSETYTKICEKYENSVFMVYDNSNAEVAFSQIKNQIQNYICENLLLIGQSLGGFWAEKFAIYYDLHSILINPSFEPEFSLKKYDLSVDDLNSFQNFKSIEFSKKKISIILSKNDSIVNPAPVLQKYKNFANFKYVNGDHKLVEFETLFSEIVEMSLDINNEKPNCY